MVNKLFSKFNKTTAVYFLAFFLATIAAAVVFTLNGIYPNGEKSLLIMDMSGQYASFFASLHGISDPNQLLYSWNNAMGSGFLPLFSYYLSSPFSLFVLLFPKENMETAIYFLTLLKIGLSSLSFCIFMRYKYKLYQLSHIAFSLCYSLMSYTFVYSMCLMWLDSVIWLPILILGVDKIINENKMKLFLVILTIMIFSNYYTAYMSFIFAFLYFILRCVGELKLSFSEIWKRLKKAILATITAVGLTSFLTIPTLCSLFSGRISYNIAPESSTNFEFAEIFPKFLSGNYDSITNSGLPSIFVGILCLILFIMFFVNSQFSKRERISTLILFVFLIISFYITGLDLFWHAMSSPSWFPYRYAFVYGFFVIYISSKSLFNLSLHIPKNIKSIIFISIILISLVDMTFNGYHMIKGLDEQFAYDENGKFEDFHNQLQPLVDYAEENSEDEFFRMEKNFERSKNDSASLGYNGITHYSSTFSDKTNKTLHELGFAQEYFWSSYYGATPITDYLFSMKYLMIKGDAWGDYDAVASSDDITLYYNKNTLPIATIAQGELFEFNLDKFSNQENLLKFIAPYEGSVFENVQNGTYQIEENVIYTEFTTAISGDLFANISPHTHFEIWVNDEKLPKYVPYYQEGTTAYLGYFEADELVKMTLYCSNPPINDTLFNIKTLNAEKFNEVISSIKTNQISVSEREVVMNLGTENGGYLYTSIPFDKGWTVLADGVEIQSEILADAFLTAKIPENTSEVVLKFTPQGFNLGAVISITTLLVISFIYIKLNRKNNREI